jgi:hypothetical protein
METPKLIAIALTPIAIAGWLWMSKALEQRIRRMPPSLWRRVLLLGRK